MEPTTPTPDEPNTPRSPHRSHTPGSWRKTDSQLWLDEFDAILSNNDQQDIQALKASLRQQLATARAALNAAADSANSYIRGTFDCAVDCAEEYVETRPWRAVSYAAGVAFLLGVIVGRR